MQKNGFLIASVQEMKLTQDCSKDDFTILMQDRNQGKGCIAFFNSPDVNLDQQVM